MSNHSAQGFCPWVILSKYHTDHDKLIITSSIISLSVTL